MNDMATESEGHQEQDGMRIIIVGGGIAGLATSIALRSPNRTITVLERSRMLKETGALISLQPNASKIVLSWGLAPFLEPCEPIVDTAFRMVDASGKLVRQLDLDFARFGADRVVYHRQDLHTALLKAATSTDLPGRPVEIRTASRVTACDPDEGTVTIDGGETLDADIIIGADGIHSAVREAVVGEPREAVPTGTSAYRMLLPVEALSGLKIPKDVLDITQTVTTMVVGHDRRVIMGPGRGGKVFGIVALVPDEHMREKTPASDSWVTQGSPSALLRAFEARHERAGLIQQYSREQARPGTDVGSNRIKLDPAQFMEYNCNYSGAKDWVAQKDLGSAVEKLSVSGS
ncbi:zeaxanthin epoxidase [Parachaetomium inaequale]|uniref:Zeaxanthin epoxidase n=1 Tax=Parachaetomium inaequale TaxID=2588326 RepID=A0AAN6SVZ0_9PEZI|nr:zeaxanthin epoxidase [Parachaetomium inaequale]